MNGNDIYTDPNEILYREVNEIYSKIEFLKHEIALIKMGESKLPINMVGEFEKLLEVERIKLAIAIEENIDIKKWKNKSEKEILKRLKTPIYDKLSV